MNIKNALIANIDDLENDNATVMNADAGGDIGKLDVYLDDLRNEIIITGSSLEILKKPAHVIPERDFKK
ncbi:hypothetical protein [Lactobacillus hominis]|uniref:hypothetical protein n=1 Tax=Lactobacillus hominis TaxID=1203033 RepID=UPI00058E3E55|nr:hypothetical protein [Lactobacillus hominis]MCT3348919.1 hypothetical protein [Lactobacillus hominis]